MDGKLFFRLLLAVVSGNYLVHRAYAGVVATLPESVTGLYVGAWAQDTGSTQNFFDMSAMNLQGVSHVYYSFLWIRPTTFVVYDPFNNLNLFMSIKPRWPDTKFMLSIGGGGFNTTTWTRAATIGLTTFVNSMIKAMKDVNADGIDIDWETPDASTRDAFTRLCATLRVRLDAEGAAASPPRHYWLTAATPSIVTADGFDGFNLTALKTSLDLFNIMTYSMHDPCYWETQTNFHTAWSECTKALDYYISRGVPRTQLVLGLAFYGHVYNLIDPTNYMYPAPSVESRDCSTMTTPSYREILRELSYSSGGVFVDGPQRSAYYVHDTRWVTFDIPETMALKIQGVREYAIGGVMIWDASLDTPDGSLLRAVASRQMNTTRPCGSGYIGTGVCANTSQCCSEFGYCALNGNVCGPKCRSGPCIPYSSPPPRPPPPTPNCGNGVIGSGICAITTECCSVAGYCGTTEPWCGANCVGGPCWYRPKSPPPPRSPPPKPVPPPPRVVYTCGEGIIGNGTCPSPNDCCSSVGWCGNTPVHCGLGCNGGPCIPSSPPPPGINGPLCGGGVVGNGQCGYSWECCSQWGYCGDTADHCGANCQGGACWYPPPSRTNTSSPPALIPPSPAKKRLPSPPSPKPPSPAPPPPRPRPPSPPPPKSPSPPPPKLPSPPPPKSPSPPPPKPPSPPPPKSPLPPPPAVKLPSPQKQPSSKPPSLKAPSPPLSSPQPSDALVPCGNGRVGNGTCSDPTLCCSIFGFCAQSKDHCYWACVGGPCWEPPPPPPATPGALVPPSPPPPAPADTVWCGDGVVGNKLCRLKNLCCSAAGFCSNTEDHCLNYCVGGPCWAPPPQAVQIMPNSTFPSATKGRRFLQRDP